MATHSSNLIRQQTIVYKWFPTHLPLLQLQCHTDRDHRINLQERIILGLRAERSGNSPKGKRRPKVCTSRNAYSATDKKITWTRNDIHHSPSKVDENVSLSLKHTFCTTTVQDAGLESRQIRESRNSREIPHFYKLDVPKKVYRNFHVPLL